ncbi:MAG: glycosyltransferase family 2 protein [Pseudomonadota bacterium]
MTDVCIIIVNYNSGDLLSQCLKAVMAQTYQDFEVILVDNASEDNSIENLPKLPKKVDLIKNKKNLGFAAANNMAIMRTSALWVVTLNPDTYPEKEWLEKLRAATGRHPDVNMFGSTQVEPGKEGILDGYGDYYHISGAVWRGLKGQVAKGPLAEGQCFAPCAAAALYRTDLLRQVGGFDERFFCYCEDVDLAFRLRLIGQLAVQVPDAIVSHVGSATSGRYSRFSVYHGVRNRLWMYVKNMPGILFWLFLPAHIGLQFGALFRSAFLGTLGPTCCGLRDGIVDLSKVLNDRKKIQKERTASICQIAAALTWSPLKLLNRSAPIKQIK